LSPWIRAEAFLIGRNKDPLTGCAHWGQAEPSAQLKAGRFLTNVATGLHSSTLHFDPATQSARRSAGQSGSPLARRRMDFLILFSSRYRVVLEVDGVQHYANGDTARPAHYGEMVSEDRRLRLAGYEVTGSAGPS
jgi:hypothetical protein